MRRKFVLDLSEIAADQLDLVGAKALSLALAVHAGLPVPPGFVITTQAYRNAGDPSIWSEVAEAYERLGGRVAVRSSGTMEDLEEASFAGQRTSFLNVSGSAAVAEATQNCWRSLCGERAAAYHRSLGIAADGAAMAVLVQRMVDAEAAGVLFTRDPLDLTGRKMVVNAAWGLGEAVVSGRVMPDAWDLDRETGSVLEARIADKTVRTTRDGVESVPESLRRRPSLDPPTLESLFSLSRRAERVYGAAQDLEWALSGGEILLLQSRPITAGGSERERVRREEIERLKRRAAPGGTVWSRYSLAEELPEPLPYTFALWKGFMSGSGGYGAMYRALGFDPDPCLDSDGVLDLIAGRLYFNLSRDARLYFRDYPAEYPFAKLKADPGLAIYPRTEPNLTIAPKGFLFKLMGTARKMLAAERTLDRRADELPASLYEQLFPSMVRYAGDQRASDLGRLSDRALTGAIADCRTFLFRSFLPESLQASVIAGLAVRKLESELLAVCGEGRSQPALDSLIAGAAPPPEHDLGRALRLLARGELAPGDFLTAFGHRGPGEMELANPRWREGIALPATSAGACVDRVASREAPVESLEGLFGSRRARLKFAARHLERARRFIGLRESSRNVFMLGYEVLRLYLLELDRRLGLDSGIFYLEPQEPEELSAGEMQSRIADRMRRRRLALGIPVPRVLFSDDLEAVGRPEPPPATVNHLRGTGISAGAAEGEALVLRAPEQAPPEARDFILVCPSTDPGWVPLFFRARGLIVETGGILSHGAIVAREFGLPAVANVPGACDRFHTGQRLRLDGGTGDVWPLSYPGSPR